MVRIDSPDSGSNYQFQDKILPPNVGRSVFSLSHQNICSIPHQGSLIPICVFETVPNDSFEISVSTLLRVLPQVVPLYSQQRITIHAFYSRMGDLFDSFSTFMTKGYSGNRVLKIPTVNVALSDKFADNSAVVGPNDLLHYLMNIPVGTKYKDLVDKVSALPLMMYLRIWRDYFMNKYFYIDDRVLLPDSDDTFRLNSDGRVVSDPKFTLDLTDWRFRDFADDRFTSSMPSPQRGDAPTLGMSISGTDAKLPVFSEVFLNDDFYKDKVDLQWHLLSMRDSANPFYPHLSAVFKDFQQFDTYFGYAGKNLGPANIVSGNIPIPPTDVTDTYAFKPYARLDPSILSSDIKITLNDIRQLAIAQTELERMARTDGSYQEFGLTFFGRSSKNAVDYQPLYIGGTYQPVIFSEVVQTSASTPTSAMGTYAGHGISQDNNGYIGKVDCDDYGYIMLVASIMPDTYYSQGIDKQFTRLYQADFFLPDRAKLGAQPIYNKELYFTGNSEQDDGLFAYQDIFDELRYTPNSVHGALADPSQLSFFPYTQSRHFTELPTYSQSFATTKGNVRYDYLFAPNEVPYTAKFGINIRAVRPLPYKAYPAPVV